MGFPEHLLMSDEELVLDLRPHWIVLAGLVVALVAYPVRRVVWGLTSHFLVTSVRIIHRQGWVARSSKDIPLEAINDVRFKQSMLERVVGAGSLVVRSAFAAGRQEFRAVREPQDVLKTIYEERRKRMARSQ